jgi:hypothetical protein
MTLEQLKSLKVGDIVRYTNKEDATDCTDWKIKVADTSNNELQIILHQIRDCEFDLNICQRRMDAILISNNKQALIAEIAIKNGEYKELLKSLRNKRDNLLKQNI